MLVLLFLVLFPYNTIGNSASLNHLISNAITNNIIDVQFFWKVREFMSPGHLELNKEKQYPSPFLVFTSKKWQSSEYLTQISTLAPNLSDECNDVLLMTQQDLICNLSDGSILIAFVRGQDEMRKANVFFDPKHDAKLIAGKYWLVISYIQ